MQELQKLVPRIKQLWLDALRSDEYKQGKSSLCLSYKTGKEHCCLGVLCEVYIKDTGHDIFEKHSSSYDGSSSHPPPIVTEWAFGKTESERLPDWYVIENGEHVSLTHLNDYRHFSFSKIADMIEESL